MYGQYVADGLIKSMVLDITENYSETLGSSKTRNDIEWRAMRVSSRVYGSVRRLASSQTPLSIDALSRVNAERLRSTTEIRDRLQRRGVHSFREDACSN